MATKQATQGKDLLIYLLTESKWKIDRHGNYVKVSALTGRKYRYKFQSIGYRIEVYNVDLKKWFNLNRFNQSCYFKDITTETKILAV